MKELLSVVEVLDSHIESITAKLEKASKEIPIAKLLMTMPGVGPITSLTVVAAVGEFSRFEKASKLTAFAGLVPKQRSSEEKVRLGSITHLGSRYLRTTMVEAAMRIRAGYPPELYQFFESLEPNCGTKRARVALARKMLTIMWAMAKHNTPYIPQKNLTSSPFSAIRKESYLDGHRDA